MVAIYIETYGSGGIIRDFVPLLRTKYSNDINFKNLIDNLPIQEIYSFISWTLDSMKKNGDNFGGKIYYNENLIKQLFDEDMVLTIKDRIQAPVYHENSEEELREMLKNNGVKEIRRLTRYPFLTNLRRYLAPMYN
jgi:hypothetical protein